jgi:hypothetical protein
MENGKRTEAGVEGLAAIQQRCRTELDKLPEQLLRLEPAEDGYPVRISQTLQQDQQRLIEHYQP